MKGVFEQFVSARAPRSLPSAALKEKAAGNRQLFDFTHNAFFPARRWKLSKNLLGLVIVSAFFQFNAFAAPAMAQEAVESENYTIAVLPGGAVINSEEAELLQQGLVLVEHETADTNVLTDSAYATSTDYAPLENPDLKQVVELRESAYIRTDSDLGIRTMTAYNSEPGQTDNSPCITANGFDVCKHGIEDTVAANFLPFGTKIRIPELFGDRIFIVRDRMNSRYPDRIDVWMLEKSDARQFGVRRAHVELVLDQ